MVSVRRFQSSTWSDVSRVWRFQHCPAVLNSKVIQNSQHLGRYRAVRAVKKVKLLRSLKMKSAKKMVHIRPGCQWRDEPAIPCQTILWLCKFVCIVWSKGRRGGEAGISETLRPCQSLAGLRFVSSLLRLYHTLWLNFLISWYHLFYGHCWSLDWIKFCRKIGLYERGTGGFTILWFYL